MYNFLSEAEKTAFFWLTGTVGKRPNYSITKNNNISSLLNYISILNIKTNLKNFFPVLKD